MRVSTSASIATARIADVLPDLETRIARFLWSQAGPIAAEASRLYRIQSRTLQKADIPESVDSIVSGVSIDWKRLVSTTAKPSASVFEDALKSAFAALAVDVPGGASGPNAAAIAWAEQRGADLVGMKWVDGELVDNPDAAWSIADSTREILREEIVVAFEQGYTPAKLAAEIRSSPAFSDFRASMIARTEMATAQVQGSLQAWRESGVVVGKRLLLSADHTRPDECDEAAAQGAVALNQDFGGFGDAPLHPFCECVVVAVTDATELAA